MTTEQPQLQTPLANVNGVEVEHADVPAPETTDAHAANVPEPVVDDAHEALQASRADVWYLKEISFSGKPMKIITQNYNGPCSLIAICNILILRGDIEIQPPERTSVSYEFLSQLVGEYLLRASPDVDISAALSIMPLTQKGMDLNPLFTNATAFRPAGDDGSALKLFEQANIKLVHGWLVDPESSEFGVLKETQDYDNSVNLIVEADSLSNGQFVVADDDIPEAAQAGSSSSSSGPGTGLSAEVQEKLTKASIVRTFLDSSRSQMTYHGLFTLAQTLPPGTLVALFRNLHLSVLYKPSPSDIVPPPSDSGTDSGTGADAINPAPSSTDSSLYTLATDIVFLHERQVVWERLDDVDGGSSTFVDAAFARSSPAGGDFAGHTAESALAAFEAEAGLYAVSDPADLQLAQQLQAEEDAHAQQMYAERQRQRAQQRGQRGQGQQQQPQDGQQEGQNPFEEPRRKTKKRPSCIIM